MRYIVYGKTVLDNIGHYELTSLPGCNQIVVSHHAFINEEHRGKGNGKAAHYERLRHIDDLNYDYALCTINKANEAQSKILAKARWKMLDEFVNKETGNTVQIWGRRMGK